MKRWNVVVCALLLTLSALAGLGRAETPAADRTTARALVRQLAAEEFAVREEATRRLSALGKSAEEALKEGIAGDDAEVRRRCTDLLELTQRSEIEVVLAAFLVDHDEKILQKLAAYPRFIKLVGDTPAARTLFVEMCLTDATLLIDVEKNPAAAAATITTRCQQYQQRMRFGFQPVPFGQVALMLYVASEPSVPIELNNLHMLSNMLYHPDVRVGLTNNLAARQLLVTFLERRTDPNFIYQKLNLAQLHNLKECLPWALAVAKDQTQQAHVRAQALSLVARLGNKANMADIEPMLGDTTALGQIEFNKQLRINTELRDVALGVLIVLSGQRIEDYEFPYFQMFPQVLKQQQQNSNGFNLPYHCLGFSDNVGREAAHKKWKDWVAVQK